MNKQERDEVFKAIGRALAEQDNAAAIDTYGRSGDERSRTAHADANTALRELFALIYSLPLDDEVAYVPVVSLPSYSGDELSPHGRD